MAEQTKSITYYDGRTRTFSAAEGYTFIDNDFGTFVERPNGTRMLFDAAEEQGIVTLVEGDELVSLAPDDIEAVAAPTMDVSAAMARSTLYGHCDCNHVFGECPND